MTPPGTRPSTPPAPFPTGAQYEITAGEVSAVVCEIGATLRTLTVGDHHLVHGFGADEVIDKACRGQQLLPWPNRIRDGRWTWQDVEQQLPLSEPERGTAIHGLVRWVAWDLVDHGLDQVTQRLVLRPQHGWPGTLEITLTHRVDRTGLTVELLVTNPSEVDVPFGYGVHPYLSVGEDRIDEVELQLPAGAYLTVDDRLLPISVEPVDADHDLRTPRLVDDLSLDTAFTQLESEAGRWEVRLRKGERHTTLWADDVFGWLQVFTGEPTRQWGLAVEPMTCGPDAFNPGPTHDDLIVLRPRGRFAGSWGITGA
ncbi:aldose 1-epimerase family protein [Propionibacteriaceae bacterium Y1685]|uniref:aldose 1-epimerase family protein n=1 Tax=Microlunatus sp. Y1700 TaxID=3418487 RepID=UPI003B75D8A8